MAMKLFRTASVLVAFAATSALPGVANAQALPTAPEVGLTLDVGCATTPSGQLLDEAACLVAIMTAVGVAEQYAALGGNPVDLVPPQLDIGYYLCQLGIRVPVVFDDIVAAIQAAFNINLETGCQEALEAVEQPEPPPRISPA
ncbi:MAG: hypothetical protein KIT43_05400 [Bauldia sp.]|nr:hypothetical protein [Bauldia sp.]